MKRFGFTAAVLLTTAASASAGGVANFAHSTFDLSEWTREAHTKPLNGTEGGVVFILNGTHQQTGGCLELRWFTPVPTTIFGIAFLDEATWDPASNGEILTLSIGMAAVQLDPNETTVQQGRFFIEQDGHYYYHQFSPAGIDSVELYFETGLDATDFREVFFNSEQSSNPNSNPDFSENGEPIRFGFGQGFAFFDGLVNTNIKTGIDNFSLQIVHGPAPGPICPGDFNNDGQINLADLNILLANFGSDVTAWADGDATGDAFVDLADLNQVLASFGTVCF